MKVAQPPPVPTGTLAALLDALPHSKERDPDLQLLELAVATGISPDIVRTGLARLRWYRMARQQADGKWRLTWRTKL